MKFSDRSKTAIQPYLSDQWFVKMAPLAEPALEVVRDGTIKFFPERHAQQYLSWLGEKRDWPISRQLWWGHRIPVWHLRMETRDPRFSDLITADIVDAAEWVESRNTVACAFNAETGERVNLRLELERSSDFVKSELDLYVCSTEDEAARKFEELGFVRDPDVLDTWFSSALWPHSTLGWPEATADLARWYPTSVLMTGRDIITLWVARMVMMGMYNMGEKTPTTPLSLH